ncbi:MAG: hypothetical protein A3D92_19385 [Bacteroidetes bacterium RIFCSPHIGHO2_02_FULL_44_7]|nr:MAG: hypothetical protein A3D92_19385 [Bacteroidetes bacterium RIFCSPHIGHO2_02_FULL_44_7]
MFGVGATQFLGDLGGRDQIGKDYSLVDMDWPSTGFGGMIGYRYRFHPYWATTTSLNIGLLRGNDALTDEIIRQSRNLHFRSIVVELSQRLEVIILANEKFGHRYGLSRHSKKMKDHNEQLYLFGGIGINYFNPKAQYQGSWTALRPLSTEGQGLPDGPKKALPVTATVPVGIGFRWGLNRMWRMGVEATYVKTFSDYIDDVSTTYYDPTILAAEKGPEAAYLSNPSQQNTTWFGAGQQRGDAQKDAYFYVNFVFARNLTYKDYAKQRKQARWKGKYKF